MFFEEFPELLDYCNSHTTSPIILGDVNFHFDKPDNASTAKLLNHLDVFNFRQSVTESTHCEGHILDWVMYRPDDNAVKSTTVTHSLTSDHYTVNCILNVDVPPSLIVYKNKCSLRTMDMPAFRTDIQDAVSSISSADELDSALRSVLDKHAPMSRCAIRPGKQAPWYSDIRDDLTDAKKQRRRAEKQWLDTGLTVHKQIFNAAKRLVIKIVHKAKCTFFCSKVSNSVSNKELFTVCADLGGRAKCTPLPTVYPSCKLPDVFCEYFIRKVVDIRSELDKHACTSRAAGDAHTNSSTDGHCSRSFVSFQPVTVEEVKKIIMSSKPTTCSIDPIPTPLLIDSLDTLLPSVTAIVNDSLRTGLFPKLFKTAAVKPLLKNASLYQNNLKNYRPVSNLSFLSKVIEKVVQQQLFSYLDSNQLLPESQSAYRPSHSTETALIKVISDILLALDSGKVSVLTLLDLSAAFDTIDHEILLVRLSSLYGISGIALKWFNSYLSNRSQFVTVNDRNSKSTPVAFGVPQGSVLGPILFILYTKPLSSLIKAHSVNSQSFADDTQIHDSCLAEQLQATIETIQDCIADVRHWMTQNKLKLNDEKTEALLVKSNRCTTLNPSLTSVTVGTADIPFVPFVRDLGFMVTATELSLRNQVSNICRSANLEIRRISSIRQFPPLKPRKPLSVHLSFRDLTFATLFSPVVTKCIHRDCNWFKTLQQDWFFGQRNVIT